MHQWIPAVAQWKWKHRLVRLQLIIANLARATFNQINMRGKKDPKLGCHIVKTSFLNLYLLSKPMEIFNTSETWNKLINWVQ